MDLFPKDYKQDGAILGGPSAGPKAFLGNLKNKLAGGGQKMGSVLSRSGDLFLRLGVILGGVALALILILWGGLVFYKKSLVKQADDLKAKQAAIFSDKDKDIAAKIVALEKGAALAQGLFQKHIYASGIFDKVAAATLPRVQWQSFDFSAKDGSVSMKGLAADYATLAKQILALEEEKFSDVKIGGITLDKAGGVNFDAAFNFDPKTLLK